MKKQICFALAAVMIFSLGISTYAEETGTAQVTEPLDTLEFTLPDGVTLRRDSSSRETFVKGSAEVGGVFLLDCDEGIINNVLDQNPLIDEVTSAMKDDADDEWEWYMGCSSLYGLLEVGMGNGQEEYMAYVVRGYSACYIFWFDRNQFSTDDEIATMESLTSDDITNELNMISTQEYADAIAESMANEEYRFELTLPSGMEMGNRTEDSALLYQDDKLVGGYLTVHFEKGILPNVHENQELIVKQLQEYLEKQIDLTDFTGKIINEDGLITVSFTNGDTEYTHYILSYGQVGTQYDVWFDESQVEQKTVTQIISNAQLIQE